MAINDLLKGIVVAATLATAGCGTTRTMVSGPEHVSSGPDRYSSPRTEESANALAARNAQRGLQFDSVHGYTPQEDRSFSYGLSEEERNRYGGHQAPK